MLGYAYIFQNYKKCIMHPSNSILIFFLYLLWRHFHSSKYILFRPSPIWVVSKAAQNAQPSARVESLATPKPHVKDFQKERSVYSAVSNAAKNATASARIEALSKPKV